MNAQIVKVTSIVVLIFFFSGCKKDELVEPDTLNAPEQVTIDSRTESLMIDQINGAKKINVTSGRSYRLTLTSNATPLYDRVCVMYQSTAGLTVDVLREGSPLQFTAGYTQVYVWLVDWSTITDNTGAATITVVDLSTSSTTTVVIDSRSESILLDGRADVKFHALTSGKRYSVSLNSSATPIPDRVFMMYQSVENGLLVDVVTESAPVNFTSQYTQCALFMPDWSTRGDNSGAAVVTITPK